VLGHLQRGGMPTGYDRLLATRFGGAAVRAVDEEKWGHMMALQSPHIVAIPIEEALREPKRVDPSHDVVQTARETGIPLETRAVIRRQKKWLRPIFSPRGQQFPASRTPLHCSRFCIQCKSL